MGALAAIGLVLCARVAGDVRRPLGLRAAAAACAAPLGAGLYLSFSRGALAAAVAGLVVLALAAPSRAQLRSIGIAVAAAVLATVPAAASSGVRALEGSLASRERAGLVFLAALAVVIAAAGIVQLVLGRREAGGRLRIEPVRLPRRAPVYFAVAVVLAAGALVAAASKEGPRQSKAPAFGATTQRFNSVESNRYSYWKVALGVFADHPLKGDGTHSFQVDWIQERKISDPAKDAHSLYIETAAELGLLGLAALALFLGGAGVAAARARRLDPALAAGPIAAGSALLVHAGLDWDWEMPAVSLVGIVLMAALLAAADHVPRVSSQREQPSQEAQPPAGPPDVPAGARAGA
jgi:hypothetical protein